jgi:hypothetical protein
MSLVSPSFLKGTDFSAYAEFVAFQDKWTEETAWLYAKLVRIRNFGMGEEFSDPWSPPDLYSEQFNDAGVFYIARVVQTEVEVHVVMCTSFAGMENLSAVGQEITRRRGIVGV